MLDFANTTPNMNFRLGCATLPQLAFRGESDPNWDNVVVKSERKVKVVNSVIMKAAHTYSQEKKRSRDCRSHRPVFGKACSVLARTGLSVVLYLLVWRGYRTECLVLRARTKVMSEPRAAWPLTSNPLAVGNRRKGGKIFPGYFGKIVRYPPLLTIIHRVVVS